MNSLSWLIYLAGVTDSLSNFLKFLTCVLFVLCVILTLLSVALLNTTGLSEKEKVTQAAAQKVCKRYAILIFVVFFCFGLLVNVLPNRQTVLLIAASEIGERAMNSEKMAKINDKVVSVIDPSVELLNVWIAKQTEDLRKEMNTQKK